MKCLHLSVKVPFAIWAPAAEPEVDVPDALVDFRDVVSVVLQELVVGATLEIVNLRVRSRVCQAVTHGDVVLVPVEDRIVLRLDNEVRHERCEERVLPRLGDVVSQLFG